LVAGLPRFAAVRFDFLDLVLLDLVFRFLAIGSSPAMSQAAMTERPDAIPLRRAPPSGVEAVESLRPISEVHDNALRSGRFPPYHARKSKGLTVAGHA
jgi:hypothetical protein